MKNSIKQSYVSETTFKKEADWNRGEFKKVHKDIEEIKLTMMTMKTDLGQAIIKNQTRIEQVAENMMTKDAGDQILSQLQDLAKKEIWENAEASAHIHLNQVMDFRPRIEDHEQRLVALEKRPPTINQQ